jgi:hypothetical protein
VAETCSAKYSNKYFALTVKLYTRKTIHTQQDANLKNKDSICSRCSHLEHRASAKRLFHFSFIILVSRTPWAGDQPDAWSLPKQTKRNTTIHSLSGIRAHDPSVRVGEDTSWLKSHGHYDRRISIGYCVFVTAPGKKFMGRAPKYNWSDHNRSGDTMEELEQNPCYTTFWNLEEYGNHRCENLNSYS